MDWSSCDQHIHYVAHTDGASSFYRADYHKALFRPIKVGEVEQEFTIAAIVKDAVFGSTMMGFKRALIIPISL